MRRLNLCQKLPVAKLRSKSTSHGLKTGPKSKNGHVPKTGPSGAGLYVNAFRKHYLKTQFFIVRHQYSGIYISAAIYCGLSCVLAQIYCCRAFPIFSLLTLRLCLRTLPLLFSGTPAFVYELSHFNFCTLPRRNKKTNKSPLTFIRFSFAFYFWRIFRLNSPVFPLQSPPAL